MQHSSVKISLSLGLSLAAILLSGATLAQGNQTNDTSRLSIGTPIKVTLLENLNSETARPGEQIRVRVASDDTSGLPHGTMFYGRVLDVRAATKTEPGVINLRFDNGTNYDSPNFVNDEASAQLSGQKPVVDKGHNYVAYGAGGGALLGLLRAGKVGDALEGAALGALGGYAADKAMTHPATNVSLKRDSEITMRLDRPLTLQTALSNY